MALARCELHPPDPNRGKNIYTRAVQPVGYPDTALVCGSEHCQAPALLWLTPVEARDYERGQRVFPGPTAVVKFLVL